MKKTLQEKTEGLCKKYVVTFKELSKIFNDVHETKYLNEYVCVKPQHEEVMRLAVFFDVSTDYLVGNTDVKLPASKIVNNKGAEKTIAVLENFSKKQRLEILNKIKTREANAPKHENTKSLKKNRDFSDLEKRADVMFDIMNNLSPDKFLAKRMKLIREELNYTQLELGNLLNCRPSTISSYERGPNAPTFQWLLHMSKMFGVSVDYLLGVSDDRQMLSDIIKDKEIQMIIEAMFYLQKKDRKDMLENIQFLKWKNENSDSKLDLGVVGDDIDDEDDSEELSYQEFDFEKPVPKFVVYPENDIYNYGYIPSMSMVDKYEDDVDNDSDVAQSDD